MKTNILNRIMSVMMASLLFLGLFPGSPNVVAQTQVKGTIVANVTPGISNSNQDMQVQVGPTTPKCDLGYVSGSDGSCVRVVKFFSWPSKTLEQVRSLAASKNWELATRQQVTEAWQKAGLHTFAFGMTNTGDMCVPIQSDVSTFKKGTNCGDNRGNQGFFYVVKNYNNPGTLDKSEKIELTKVVTEVSFGPQSGEKGLFRQVGPNTWEYRTTGRPYDKLAATCVESSRREVTVLLSCESNKYQFEINLDNYNITKIEGGRRTTLQYEPNRYALVRYVDSFPVILDKDLKNPFKPGEIEQIMQWIAKETSNSQIGFCYKNTKGRGVGRPLTTCPAGQERNGALCYPNCTARGGTQYAGNGPVCWGKCPSGFRDIGAFCQKTGEYTREGFGWRAGDPLLPNYSGPRGRCERKYGRNNCEQKGAVIYPKCKAGFKQTIVTKCAPTCPAGWADTGSGCTKPSYTRGSAPMKCGPGLEEQNGLCYQQCPANLSDGAGPVCWQQCTGDQPEQCGVGCAADKNACASAVSDMVFSPIFLVLGLVDMGLSAKIKNAAILAQKNATTALGATGGAAGIVKGGLTSDTFRNSGKWTKLFNELKNLSALEKAGKITDLVSLGADLSAIGQGAREEIEKWTSEYEDKFANNTSPAIEATIRRSFDYNTQRYIKRHYSVHHLGSILESDGWRIGKLVMGIAGTAVVVDPGFIATINAYTQPMCPQPGANPLPNVIPNRNVNKVSSTAPSPATPAPATPTVGLVWKQIVGSLKHASVGGDGTMWGVNSADNIYRWTGSTWVNVRGKLKQISVGSASHVWGVNSADNIYQWTGTTWRNIPGKLKHVSVGSDGTVWGVNSADNIYRWTGSTWVNVPGKLKQISAGASDQVSGVNSGDQIYIRTF